MRKLLLFLTISLLFPAVPVSAQQEKTSISVSPAITEWIAAPGQKITKTIIVTNTTKDIVPLQSFVQTMPIDGNMTQNNSNIISASRWFSIAEPDFILRPKQSRRVNIVLTVPKNAEPGGKYATVYFRQLNAASAQPQTHVVPRVGVLAFVVVKGKITKWLQPESLSIQQKNNSIDMTLQIKNTGNVHVFPQGNFVVKDWWGREVAQLPIKTGVILPGGIRQYTANWQPKQAGIYSVHTKVSLGERRLPILSAMVWQVPWKGALLVVVILLLCWAGIYRIRHRWMRAIRSLRQ